MTAAQAVRPLALIIHASWWSAWRDCWVVA
jgi:hypothetical protein